MDPKACIAVPNTMFLVVGKKRVEYEHGAISMSSASLKLCRTVQTSERAMMFIVLNINERMICTKSQLMQLLDIVDNKSTFTTKPKAMLFLLKLIALRRLDGFSC